MPDVHVREPFMTATGVSWQIQSGANKGATVFTGSDVLIEVGPATGGPIGRLKTHRETLEKIANEKYNKGLTNKDGIVDILSEDLLNPDLNRA